ncbi:MAG: hypothetical protein KC983_00265 [Phycisphaerales bacterium]|nr:hypothetical protein [Phycisphaerales bacterium]
MTESALSIQNVPWTELIPIAMVTVVGLVMWVAGRRCLKYAFAVLGLLAGGLVGWVLGTSIDVGIAPWIPAVFLAVLLATVAALAYRLAVAATLAVVLGISGPMLVRTIAQARGMPLLETTAEAADDDAARTWDDATDALSDPDAMDEIDRWLNGDAVSDEAATRLGDEVRETVRETADRLGVSVDTDEQIAHARHFGAWVAETVRAEWARTPEALRPTILMAAASGVLLGALLGALAPMVGASIVTSFGGSLLWLSGLRLVLIRVGAPTEWLPESPAVWLLLWLLVALTGIAIQWTTGPRKADNAD